MSGPPLRGTASTQNSHFDIDATRLTWLWLWRLAAGLVSLSHMTPLRVRLGRAIGRLRKNAGISQEGLAGKAKLHRTTMSEIERGVSNVSVDIAERVAKALGVSLSKLFQEAEDR